MLKKLACVLSLLLVAGCEQSTIKGEIAERLGNPSSLKFTDFEWIDNFDTRTDCGEGHKGNVRYCPIACVGVKRRYGTVYMVSKSPEGYYSEREVETHTIESCASHFATERW
jgi:hypothetical protein